MRVYRREKRKKSIKEIAMGTVKEMQKEVEAFIYNNTKLILYLCQIALFLVLYALIPYIGITLCVVIYLLFLVLFEYCVKLSANIKNETDDGIPIPEERFTQIEEGGFINVKREEESIIYLCDVENYLERKGLLKNERIKESAL